MAWTTPRNWLAGELVTETQLNEQIRDNLNVLKTPINDSGKIIALSSSYVADLDAGELTGIPLLASDNVWTGENDYDNGGTGRVVLPVGADQWAT